MENPVDQLKNVSLRLDSAHILLWFIFIVCLGLHLHIEFLNTALSRKQYSHYTKWRMGISHGMMWFSLWLYTPMEFLRCCTWKNREIEDIEVEAVS